MNTIFVWVIHGVYASGLHSKVIPVLFLTCDHSDTPGIPFEASEIWHLDTIGITNSGLCMDAPHAAIERFTSQVIKRGDRYEVPLMIMKPGLRTNHQPDQSHRSEKATYQSTALFSTTPDLLQEYHRLISE